MSMLEMPFSLFDIYAKGGTIAVTTNSVIKTNGEAVMGAGVALEAKAWQPDLPLALGAALKLHGNRVFYWAQYRMVTFPTKEDFRDPSTLELIQRSAEELKAVLYANPQLLHVYLPRPGCKNGGLSWHAVEQVLNKVFVNDMRLRVLMAKPQ